MAEAVPAIRIWPMSDRIAGFRGLGIEAVQRRYFLGKLPANGGWQPHVTLRMLMCHGAGTTVHGFAGYNRRAVIPTVTQVLAGVPPANSTSVQVSAIPGTLSSSANVVGNTAWARPAAAHTCG